MTELGFGDQGLGLLVLFGYSRNMAKPNRLIWGEVRLIKKEPSGGKMRVRGGGHHGT